MPFPSFASRVKRSAGRACGVFAFALLAVSVTAQPKGRPSPQFLQPGALDEEEGARLLRQFRHSKPASAFYFEARLIQLPRHEPARECKAEIWVRWQNPGFCRRLRVYPDSVDTPAIEFLLQNQPESAAWKLTAEGTPHARRLDGQALFDPLPPRLTLAPFDLLMPFLYWEDHVYEGPLRCKGRPAHRFLLYPPPASPARERFAAARLVLDEHFKALLKAELLDENEKTLRRFSINSFKKIQECWIARSFEVADTRTRDKTRVEITAAAINPPLPENLFDPANPRPDMPPPPAGLFFLH